MGGKGKKGEKEERGLVKRTTKALWEMFMSQMSAEEKTPNQNLCPKMLKEMVFLFNMFKKTAKKSFTTSGPLSYIYPSDFSQIFWRSI